MQFLGLPPVPPPLLCPILFLLAHIQVLHRNLRVSIQLLELRSRLPLRRSCGSSEGERAGVACPLPPLNSIEERKHMANYLCWISPAANSNLGGEIPL